MNKCRITLQEISSKATHKNYNDRAFKTLFGSIGVDPVLPFTKDEFFIESPKVIKGMSISGVQQKLSLKIENKKLVITSTDGEYILKPSPQVFPNAAENEHCAMQTSVLLGINTAQCGLIPFLDGELAYITKRFDRTSSGKVHQEDLVQGFNLPSENKYDRSYESAGKLILQMCGNKLAVILDFFKRIVHAYIIGNDDMHLKNISLMRDIENFSANYDRLTPNYDSLFSMAFENRSDLEKVLALDLLIEEEDGTFSKSYEKYGFYTGNDFKTLGNRLGLNNTVINNFFKLLLSKKPEILNLIKISFMPEEMKIKSSKIIHERLNAIFME